MAKVLLKAFVLTLLSMISFTVVGQSVIVKGTVTDHKGETLPGVNIIVEGTTRGVITDLDGTYSISVTPQDKLIYTFIGFEPQTVEVGNQEVINIQLKEVVSVLEDVTIVAFGKQKKESVVSSITTVRPSDLRVPSSNLTTALAGKMPGLISYQRSGEPGDDDADFFIRGGYNFWV